MEIKKVGSNGFKIPKYIRSARTTKDLTYDDYNDYIKKYGKHGTLGRNKHKSIREFLKEKYGTG